MTPTTEQLRASRPTARLLKFRAFAGAGKTTVLCSYAIAHPDERILYLAYNKSLQLEADAKFPGNVTCNTTHGLAFPMFGQRFKVKNAEGVSKLGNLRANDLVRVFKTTPFFAKQVLDALGAFICSDGPQIDVNHVDASVDPAHRTEVMMRARLAWARMQDVADFSLPMTHDGYLKLFQLSNPDLSSRFDTVLLDEEQDANPVTAAIVLAQFPKCRVVLVGDRHQRIYGFRRAVMASSLIGDRPHEAINLTQSFRFGEGIAYVATSLLAGFKGETVPVIGRGKHKTGWTVDRSQPYAHITRTNATIFRLAVAHLGKKRVHLLAKPADAAMGGDGPFEKVLDVYKVCDGRSREARDPFLRSFRSEGALRDYAEQTEDREILMLLGVVAEFGKDLPALVERITREACSADGADVILGTAHGTKGLEFDQVLLADDFEPLVDDRGQPRDLASDEEQQELNLIYVACTRAERNLELSPGVKAGLQALRKAGVQIPAAPSRADLEAADLAARAAFAAEQAAQATRTASRSAAIQAPARTAAPSARTADAFDTGPILAGQSAKKLMLGIEYAILRHGVLTVEGIAQKIGLGRTETVELLATMVVNTRLSRALFTATAPDVVAAVKAREARFADSFL